MLTILFLLLALGAGWLAIVGYRMGKNVKEQPFKVMAGNHFEHLSGIERVEMQERWSSRISLSFYIWILLAIIFAIFAIATLVMGY
ncbi:hypothetical protein [Herminiimonas arsenitoxidans]|uniref:hypothetical protein n=1 Tax=Herminiimonas arsenitoxidans TaxID=1809410 RepID=UPI00097048A2|nr:hypothetical protein [Herminiimonas arsenitoxidans]